MRSLVCIFPLEIERFFPAEIDETLQGVCSAEAVNLHPRDTLLPEGAAFPGSLARD